jgi:hypothetical protein
MHDIDRTQREFEAALHEMQPEHFEFPGETEAYGETGMGETYETWHEAGLQESGLQEAPFQETETYESGFEAGLHETEMQESEEMEMAAELLEVTNEAELDRFLGKLIRRVSRTVGGIVRSPLGRALGGVLRPLAKAALPLAGKALGTFVGGPIGGMIGGRLASAAGQMFGLELEGLSGEDREFEVARRFVRYASSATRNALRAAPTADPYAIARSAAAAAARQFAPGIIGRPFGVNGAAGAYFAPGSSYGYGGVVSAGSRRRGIWIRRGHRIILLGV